LKLIAMMFTAGIVLLGFFRSIDAFCVNAAANFD
jgi:hypothetical protein